MYEPVPISAINGYRLDPELMSEAMASIAAAPEEQRKDAIGFAIAILDVIEAWGIFNEDEQNLIQMSIQVRLSALANFLDSETGRGFWKQLAPGRRLLDSAVVECAAEHPLGTENGPIRFDNDSFARMVMERSTPAGSG